jgi:hypothetical protein
MTLQVELYLRPHRFQQWAICPLQEFEGRRHRVVRAAAHPHGRWPVRMQQGQRQRLQHERAASRRADGELVVAGHQLAGREHQLRRTDFGMGHGRTADPGRRLDHHQVLTHQSRLLPVRADIRDAKWLPGNHRQRQRRPQDLSAAFSGSAIEFDHGHLCSLIQ